VRHFRRNNEKLQRKEYKLTPAEDFVSPTFIREGVIEKSALFCFSLSGCFFVGASILEYEKIRYQAINALKISKVTEWFRKHQNNAMDKQKEINDELSRLKEEMRKKWNQLSPGEKIWGPICGINLLVYGLWRVPALRNFMLRNFASNPAGTKANVYWSMFFSTFSHFSLFHLCANMYVLHSFSGAVNGLGYEQFLAMYLSAGVFSSLTSYIYKVTIKSPGFSLGASGAIMAVIAYVCAQYPDTKLSILFIPGWQFSADSAIKGIMCLDFVGVLMRWRLFDHAAHLGGAAFGLFWSYYGRDNIWPQRGYIVGWWHKLRGDPKK
jgi:rhomboid-like protein